jgi:chemotaxis protein methyltransferase CheR
LLAKYFKPSGNDWVIKEEIRHMVKFSQLNLTELFPPMPQMDIIFLRNVLIYFDVDTKRLILSRVKRVLDPQGYLFLGGGETTVNLDNTFEPVQLEKTVCYKLKN